VSISLEELDSTVLRLSLDIYEKEAIIAASYALSACCSIYIESDNNYYYVTINSLPDKSKLDITYLKNNFLNKLNDQQLRIDLEKRYGPLRVLIVKQAFSPLENLETEVKRLIGRD
jgi:His-Xaa-Ser system protein HxsD